jgi:hypothetical protein
MSYTAHRRDFGSFVRESAPSKDEAAVSKAGILRRIFNAFMESRQRDVDRQITRFLAARSGGVLTDGLEHEISQGVFTSNSGLNADPFTERRFP